MTRKTVVRIGRAAVQTLRMRESGAAGDAAHVVRWVRFMDDMFGAGNWEQREGEPETNVVLRDGMFMAFKAGAGID